MPDTSYAPFDFCQAIAQHTNQVFFAYQTASNQISYLNPAFEQMFRKTRESISDPAALLQEIVHPEDQMYVKDAFRQLLEGITQKGVEFRIQWPDRSERWLCVTPFLVDDRPGQPLVIGYIEDITAAKRYDEVLSKYSNKKNAILNILSHDLAGPLTNIQGLSALLARKLQADGRQDGELHQIIGLIEKNGKQGSLLLQDFIKQEFLESAAVDMVKQRVDLAGKLKEVMEQYKQSEEQMGKTFRFAASSDEVYVEIDEPKFMQAINNLISNAIKFTPDGSVIAVSLEESEDSVLVKVEDNGIGIPEKYHATLFDKFTNARRPGVKGEASVGLGMSVIKTIVEWHGGRVWFESKEHEGSTFYVKIPKQQSLTSAFE